jgi:hypothetical protein
MEGETLALDPTRADHYFGPERPPLQSEGLALQGLRFAVQA